MDAIAKQKGFLFLALFLILSACSNFDTRHFENADSFKQYSSVKEAEAYLQRRGEALEKLNAYSKRRNQKKKSWFISLFKKEEAEEVIVRGIRASDAGVMPDMAVSESLMREAGASITNNQEAMVDEGGIVKRNGDHLIVLRKGRLYSIHIGTSMTKADEIDLQPEGWKHGAWYDELLTYKNILVVVGYSYESDNTEYVFFELSDNGKFTRKGAYLVSSSDYFSESNYASRLIDDNLVFYIEDLQISDIDNDHAELTEADPFSPITARIDELGNHQEVYPLFSEHEIYSPIISSRYLTISSVIVCPLKLENFSCKAKSVMGADIENYYASADAYYFWMRGTEWNTDYANFTDRELQRYAGSENYQRRQPKNIAAIYRIPFNDEPIGVVKLKGAPIDQFSFKQDGENLHLLGRELKEEKYWLSAKYGEGKTFLASIPSKMFSQGVVEYPATNYLEIPDERDSAKHNRFVADKLVYTSGAEGDEEFQSSVYIVSLDGSNHISEIAIDLEVSQLHPLGNNMLIIGEERYESMQYQTLQLENDIYIADIYSEPNSQAAEARSHGFFFKPDNDGGIFAIPAITQMEDDWKRINDENYFAENVADMLYTRVDHDLQLYPAGILEGDKTVVWQKEEECQASCYDWYGSSRPIFWGERIFALLKNELVEGVRTGDVIQELQRIDIRN